MDAVITPHVPAGAHLRSLIEHHPLTVLRADLEGSLLAVNETGIALFGADGLNRLIGRAIGSHLLHDDREAWTAFSRQVSRDGTGSMECAFRDLAGRSRPVIVHARACHDHPDGIDSLFLTIQPAAAQESSAALQAARAEQERLSTALSQAECERWRLSALLTDVQAREKAVEGRAQEMCDQLQEKLAMALAEQKRLAADLAASREELDRARTDSEQRHDADFQRGVAARQEEVVPILASLRAQLNDALAEQKRLRDLVEDTAIVLKREAEYTLPPVPPQVNGVPMGAAQW